MANDSNIWFQFQTFVIRRYGNVLVLIIAFLLFAILARNITWPSGRNAIRNEAANTLSSNSVVAVPRISNKVSDAAAQICKEQMNDPLRFSTCAQKVDPVTMRCKTDGMTRMHSWNDQDWYLFKYHFSKLKRTGVYVDAAANNATSRSNSYFFDKCLGWEGVCAEANPRYHDELRRKRSCKLIPTCVSDISGEEVEFLAAGNYGGIKETNKNYSPALNITGKYNLRCERIGDILQDYSVKVVDYFSLDVEGHEMKVLDGVDWNQTRFNVITVEVLALPILEIEKYLFERGYVRHFPVVDGKRLPVLRNGDAVFLHETVTWTKPK